jgi:tetratricopeptide (TPR) repeat protein
MTSHRFGRFRFDVLARELFCDGEPAALQRRTAQLLELLLERAPGLVPREEIFARLWPDGFVEDGNLFQHVYTLRRALAADPAVRVETVRGRGYRLLLPAPAGTGAPASRTRRAPAFGFAARFAAVAAVLLILVAGAARVAPDGAARRPSGLAEPAATAYRLGVYAFQRRTPAGFVKARAYFGHTVALAPRAPEGYAGLALLVATSASVGAAADSRAAYALAEARAHQALALGESGTAHAVLGFVALRRDAAPRRGLAEFDRAVAVDPENATAHEWRGIALLYAGDLPAATAAFGEAVRLDPSSSTNVYWLGVAELYGGRFADARWTLEQSRTLDGRPFERVEALLAEQTSAELAGDARAARELRERARREAAAAACAPACEDVLANAVALAEQRRDGDALRAVRLARRADPWGTRFGLLYDPRLRRLRGALL